MKVFEEVQPEIVLHLAAQPIVRDSYKDPVYTYETNVMGTVNICECVRQNPCVKSFLNVTTDKVYKNNIFIQYPISISNNPINFSTGRVIPYLEKDNYYKLQTILRNIDIPIIKTSYLEELDFDKLGKFDVMLFSNIYLYLDMDYQKYKKFLIGLRNNLTTGGKIQANYTWTNGGRGYDDFVHSSDDGFDVTEVSSVRYDGKTDFKDYVLTYKK